LSKNKIYQRWASKVSPTMSASFAQSQWKAGSIIELRYMSKHLVGTDGLWTGDTKPKCPSGTIMLIPFITCIWQQTNKNETCSLICFLLSMTTISCPETVYTLGGDRRRRFRQHPHKAHPQIYRRHQTKHVSVFT
jgi:hypothetical protein